MENEIMKVAQKYHEKEKAGHDFQHVERVAKMCSYLAKNYDVDEAVLSAAAWLHDIGRTFSKEERQGLSHSAFSKVLAVEILSEYSYTPVQIEKVQDAIGSHSFSEGLVPKTIEGKILQDADRLDAIGAIGIARTFLYDQQGIMYHDTDPRGENRSLNDDQYILDHFPLKLLKLQGGFHTPEAKQLGEKRHEFLTMFYDALMNEIQEISQG